MKNPTNKDRANVVLNVAKDVRRNICLCNRDAEGFSEHAIECPYRQMVEAALVCMAVTRTPAELNERKAQAFAESVVHFLTSSIAQPRPVCPMCNGNSKPGDWSCPCQVDADLHRKYYGVDLSETFFYNGVCGTCKEKIRDDPLTGTRCACTDKPLKASYALKKSPYESEFMQTCALPYIAIPPPVIYTVIGAALDEEAKRLTGYIRLFWDKEQTKPETDQEFRERVLDKLDHPRYEDSQILHRANLRRNARQRSCAATGIDLDLWGSTYGVERERDPTYEETDDELRRRILRKIGRNQ
jgi:hypothetical protein